MQKKELDCLKKEKEKNGNRHGFTNKKETVTTNNNSSNTLDRRFRV